MMERQKKVRERSINSRAFGDVLHRARVDLGKTQQVLADEVGMPLSKLASLEMGAFRYLPQPHEVQRLAVACGVSVDQLVIAAGYTENES